VNQRQPRDYEFESLIYSHSSNVEKLLRLIEFNKEDVKDLTADVFVIAFQRKNELKELSPTAQRAWLLRVARNLVRNHGRRKHFERRKIDRLLNEPLSENELSKDPFYGYSELEDELTRTAQIRMALDMIKPEHSKLLLLHAVGNSGKQIAQSMGVSEPAARKQLMKARKQFLEAFNAINAQAEEGRVAL
jgi:RNA polymerase sigma factor (sigma-70 family)